MAVEESSSPALWALALSFHLTHRQLQRITISNRSVLKMPGLAYNGPFIHHVDVNSNHHHGDLFGPEVVDAHWDGLNLPTVQLPNVGALPLFPKKHKACWPVQSQSPWLKIKEQQAKLLSSEVANEKGNGKYTSSGESEADLQAMVMDFMENDSCEMWDNMSDSDNGITPIDKFCENLQVKSDCSSFWGPCSGRNPRLVRWF